MKIYHHHEHHHYQHNDPQVEGRLRDVESKIDLILQNQEKIMATLDDVLKDVTDEGTQLDGISALISGLQQQVKDALAGAGVSAADQAKIDAIFAQAETNKGKIATALNAGTPASTVDPTANGPAPDAGNVQQ